MNLNIYVNPDIFQFRLQFQFKLILPFCQSLILNATRSSSQILLHIYNLNFPFIYKLHFFKLEVLLKFKQPIYKQSHKYKKNCFAFNITIPPGYKPLDKFLLCNHLMIQFTTSFFFSKWITTVRSMIRS